MAQSESLREAFKDTYAAHVFNAMHAAFSADLVRNIGAYILDRNPHSVSVARAVVTLKKPSVVAQLYADIYGGAAGIDDNAPASARRYIVQNLFNEVIDGIPAELEEIERALIDAPTGRVIEEVRNKLIDHAALEHDGQNWTIWTIDGIKLTYKQQDQYIDECTKAVAKLAHLVLRTAFEDQPSIDGMYVDEYIDVMLRGLTQQKEDRNRRLQDALRWTQRLLSGDST